MPKDIVTNQNLIVKPLLVLDNDLHILSSRYGLKRLCTLRQREGLSNELLDIDHASREEIKGRGEAGGRVSGDTHDIDFLVGNSEGGEAIGLDVTQADREIL